MNNEKIRSGSPVFLNFRVEVQCLTQDRQEIFHGEYIWHPLFPRYELKQIHKLAWHSTYINTNFWTFRSPLIELSEVFVLFLWKKIGNELSMESSYSSSISLFQFLFLAIFIGSSVGGDWIKMNEWHEKRRTPNTRYRFELMTMNPVNSVFNCWYGLLCSVPLKTKYRVKTLI